MRVIIIGTDLDTVQVRGAFQRAGFEIEAITSKSFAGIPADQRLQADAAVVARDHGDYEEFDNRECLEQIPFVAAIGAENIAAGFSNLSREENRDCNRYVLYGGEENLRAFTGLIRHKLMGEPKPPAPVPIAFDSIYTPEGGLYEDTQRYLQEYERGYDSYVGILSHRSRWVSGDLAAEYGLKEALNRRGIGVIPVFSMTNPDPELGCLSMDQAIRRFFMKDGERLIQVLINFTFFGAALEEGNSLFEKAVNFYSRLNIPVLRPIQSSYISNAQWQEDQAPLKRDTAMCFDVSEVQGMIEPVFLGGMKGKKLHDTIAERMDKISGRVAGWIRLQKKSNQEKRVAVFLNHAVCSGLEATLGRAAGLNAFESVVQLLQKLRQAGYETGEFPEDGEELRRLFLERKAYSDFRWTSAEDIKASGGVLYAMPAEEYQGLFAQMPMGARNRVEETWGRAPGEAMVLEGRLLITGIRFGHVLLMIQPKRGCFGAKCTGEVCKILQDPACPPTHQYLATYFYAEKIFGADAWIHFGTHGSLEFLPGKASGLCGDCFPDIAVGNIPNFYIYHAGCIPSAMLAKRRTYAVIIDHEPKREELHVLKEQELDALLQGLEGGFVRPGSGGGEEDGPVETGRNLFGVELARIPTREAYERGSEAAEEMVSRYLAEEGRYPRQIVLNMISLDIPRTQGEQLSLFLRLEGIRPCWNERGIVTGMERISLEELGRPRMDVAMHISGVLRDTWPEILARMDEAVLLAAQAEESPEENYVVRNLLETGRRNKAEGISRIFGNAPGVYANSIKLALKASAWKDEKDLGRYFIDSSSYVYGKEKYGRQDVGAFLDGIKRTDITCDVISMKHTDGLACGYSSRIQGGYALAAKSLGLKQRVRSYMGESCEEGIAVKTMGEHLNDSLRKTFFDESWKKRRMEQGYDGASEILYRMENVFEIQCVHQCFSDQTLDELAEDYITDEEMQRFLETQNPFAGEEMTRRFLELESRGKWNPAPQLLEGLQRAYLKAEASLEDGLKGRGEIQGGRMEIVHDGQIPEWKDRLKLTEQETEKWKEQSF